jgi:hypothetical protein
VSTLLIEGGRRPLAPFGRSNRTRPAAAAACLLTTDECPCTAIRGSTTSTSWLVADRPGAYGRPRHDDVAGALRRVSGRPTNRSSGAFAVQCLLGLAGQVRARHLAPPRDFPRRTVPHTSALAAGARIIDGPSRQAPRAAAGVTSSCGIGHRHETRPPPLRHQGRRRFATPRASRTSSARRFLEKMGAASGAGHRRSASRAARAHGAEHGSGATTSRREVGPSWPPWQVADRGARRQTSGPGSRGRRPAEDERDLSDRP